MGSAQVLAAGAVVIRDDGGEPMVLAVHRPRYDDWSLPKGKLEPGERFETAAIRELHEETGVVGRLLAELPPTDYTDRKGRSKRVRWWTVQPLEQHDRAPDDEVDDVRWLSAADALAILSYDADRSLVELAVNGQAPRSVLVIRHGHAGSRRKWVGDDRRRPLSPRGWRQARALDRQLADYEIKRILTSPLDRCVQTVEGLAAARGLEIEIDERIAEGAPLDQTLELLREAGSGTAICSHGDIIGGLMRRLGAHDDRGESRWAKGSTWVITVDSSGTLMTARYLSPPA